MLQQTDFTTQSTRASFPEWKTDDYAQFPGPEKENLFHHSAADCGIGPGLRVNDMHFIRLLQAPFHEKKMLCAFEAKFGIKRGVDLKKNDKELSKGSKLLLLQVNSEFAKKFRVKPSVPSEEDIVWISDWTRCMLLCILLSVLLSGLQSGKQSRV